MDFMRTVPDKYFELAIVDPPYGIGGFAMVRDYEKCKDVNWDLNIPDLEYFEELRRVSVNQIIWGANYFNCFNENGGAIIWVKNQPMPTFSKAEIASCSIGKKVEIYEKTWTNYVNEKQTDHPTEKPVALYKWLLKNYAKEGDKIFDSHLGSQSSRIACYDGGFDFVGCELDKDYFDAGCKRFENHIKQLTMFQ